MTAPPAPAASPAYVMPSTIGHLRALFSRLPDDQLVATSYVARKDDGRDSWPTTFWSPAQLDEAAVWCAQWAQTRNVYVRCTSLAGRPDSGRGGGDLTGALVAAWADLDVAGPGHATPASRLPHPPTIEAALSVLRDLDRPPTMTIHTGGGLHCWWILETPWVFDGADDRQAAERFTTRWGAGIAERFRQRGWHSDAVPDLARVLRVCGTWRRKANITPNRVTLHSCGEWPTGLADDPRWLPGPTYTVAELEAAIVDPPADERPAPLKRVTLPTVDRGGSYGPADAVSECMSWAEILEPAGWAFVGHDRVGGQVVELWRRPGDPTSAYSLKAFPDGPCVVWSDACGLPSGKGQRLSKWRVLVALHFRGDDRQAATDIRRWSRSAVS